jgi:hypothetical protein
LGPLVNFPTTSGTTTPMLCGTAGRMGQTQTV